MKVLNIEEHADGSATLHLEMTDEEAEQILEATEHEFYLEEAILHILEKSIENMANELNEHIYDGHPRPYCMGQSDGSRKCPVCSVSTNSMLPTTWYEENKAYMAFFCKKHGPEDLNV
jgi:hypothetical protein